MAVPQLIGPDAAFSPRNIKWESQWTKCQLTRFISRFFTFQPLIITPPLLHTHLSPSQEARDSPDQAALYHTLGSELGAPATIRHDVSLGVKVVL
jgi:hypothetical protein